MKNTFKLFGYFALIALIGFSMISCNSSWDDGSSTITGSTTYSYIMFVITQDFSGSDDAIANFESEFEDFEPTSPDGTLRFISGDMEDLYDVISGYMTPTKPAWVFVEGYDDGLELSAIQTLLDALIEEGAISSANKTTILSKLNTDGYVPAYIWLEEYDDYNDDSNDDDIVFVICISKDEE